MYYLRKSVGHFGKRLLGMKYLPDRYKPMMAEIRRIQPKRILEVGTHDGLNAVRMFKNIPDGMANSSYYGFDLFEGLDDGLYKSEFSLRALPKSTVHKHLLGSGIKHVELFAGNTNETLAAADLPTMDLIFIDGGHSEDTVRSDWENCTRFMGPDTVVYFDDYPNYGIGPVVDAIDKSQYDVQIMDDCDHFPAQKDFGYPEGQMLEIHLARVTRR